MRVIPWLGLLAALAPALSAAEDFFSAVEIDVETTKTTDTAAVQWRGNIAAGLVYGIESPLEGLPFERHEPGIKLLRTESFLEVSGTITDAVKWQLSGKTELDWLRWDDDDPSWGLDRTQARIKDAYVDVALDSGVWLRAGHQVISWGDAEGVAITDVLSPLDSRAPGQAELQDVREQIPALLASAPALEGKLTLVVSYQAGHDRYGEAHDDFYPFIALKSTGVDMRNRQPEDEWEYAGRWERQFNGGDVSVMAADVNANTLGVVEVEQSGSGRVSEVIVGQARNQVVGGTANRVVGKFLVKGEVAYHWHQQVETSRSRVWQSQNQLRSAAILEYTGFNDWILSAELNNVHPVGQSHGDASQGESGVVIRIRQSLFNERLNNQMWFYALDVQQGNDSAGILRLDSRYTLNDNWKLSGAVIVYRCRDKQSPLYPFQNNDAVNASIIYQF